ncbi:hypothetical protein PFICI_09665 [Pestalotiopsis fici W106-1]|uniref:FAD/NAD(P)-binding domain-containing protein n=1 Tax=Pestalotiopsis fici (strain W106-1 / CGMCC3.15140) TaxID=1229662 RepID=W3WUQ3_PESFW|nr:uncharacterized protein PFICI_09665 [Pestalotiopsis fici W106-1]ETS77603.1 hypothetical protein PFICI_09665 [Pestalotiopsis fici W106-1]
MSSPRKIYDVIIIGGGHAGLSAALTLYRAFHTCVVIDSGAPRDALTKQTRLTLGWEGKDPEEMRETSRSELRASGLVHFNPRTASSARKLSVGTFEVVDDAGERWTGRKVLLATGVQEIYPEIEGYAESYGTSIFHCMFCYGHEQKDSPMAGLLAVGTLTNPIHAMINARDALKYVDKVTIYTNEDSALADILSCDAAEGIHIDNRKVERLYKPESGREIGVEFEGGEREILAFLVHKPELQAGNPVPDQLGCEYVPGLGIKVTPPFNSTSVEGVYAAGDCCSPLRNIPNAMSMGSFAGCGLARELPKNRDINGMIEATSAPK